MKRLGVLVCGQAPRAVTDRHGPYLDWFTALLAPHGFDLIPWNAEALHLPANPAEADAWLITGSPHGVYEDHAFLPPLEALVRRILADRVPLVGICFGHQVIAKAMGARVEKYQGGWSFGRRAYALEDMGQVHLNACHQDQVLSVPDGATVIAQNDFTRIAGLRFGAQCVTLQPHPEITAPILADYIPRQRSLPGIDPAMVDQAQADLDKPTDEARIGAWLAGVLHGPERQ